MESVATNPGIFAAPAAFCDDYPQQQRPSAGKMIPEASVLTTPSRNTYASIESQQSAWLDTPANLHVANHFEPSNVRGSTDQDPEDIPPAGLGNDNAPIDAVLNRAWQYEDGRTSLPATPYQPADAVPPSEPKTPSNIASFAAEKSSTIEAVEAEQLTRAYAMVKFRDSHCYITTPNLVIVRDINFLQDWQAQEKERKRRAKAYEALQQYAQEPSQPSQPGDDDRHEPSSGSGDSLVGRPERGLLSHYSEQGGPVAYALSDEEEEIRSTQRERRRRRTLHNSSSGNSIAPQNLHPNEGSEFLQTGQHFNSDGHPSDPLEWAQLPVHPPRPEDIKKISREHLIFSYNSELERWELKVIGNRAFVNGTLYDKHNVVPLSHNDEIIIASLTMNFTLPDDLVKEAESEAAGDEIIESVEAGSQASMTPERRFSNAIGDSNDEGDERNSAEPRRSRIKLKLNVKKGRGKDGAKGGAKDGGKGKGRLKGDEQLSMTSGSPEAVKKAPKVRKPSDTAETVRKESSANSLPTLPLNIDPNSTLAGLAPDELPEKRKGPGRPPKNGLVSKRDDAIIRKKMKERDKKGLPALDYRMLLEETRAENRQRDLANKAQARGEPVPDIPVPSIENARAKDSGQPASQPPPDSKAPGTDSPAVPERRASPKPRRVVRSPSPMRPMSDFTEEELKKPNMTYIYIINEVLQNVDGGLADLQTIYDKIQKRWPHYYYKTGSSGWQSSVRHNLLSCGRFKEAGKSGKGKLWTINHEFQLDKQKRKPSPPATRPLPHTLQNGQYVANGQGVPQQWYGQPAYNGQFGSPNPNGQPPPNSGPQTGNGTYFSPYGPSQPMPPGNHAAAGPGSSASMPQMRPHIDGQYVQNGSRTPHQQHQRPHVQQPHTQHQPLPPPPPPPPPQAAPPATPFQPVVNAIMDYRAEYLARYVPGSDEFRRYEDRFKKGTQYFSNLFHNNVHDDSDGEDLSQEPFNRIEQIFERFKYLFKNPEQDNATPAAPNLNNTSQANMSINVGNNGGAAPSVPPSSTPGLQQQQAPIGPQGNSAASMASIHTNRPAAIAPMVAPAAAPPANMSTPVTTTAPASSTSLAPVTHIGQATASIPPDTTHSVTPAPSTPGSALEPTRPIVPPNEMPSTVQSHSIVGVPESHARSGTANGDGKSIASPDQPKSPEGGTKRAAEEPIANPDTKRIKTE